MSTETVRLSTELFMTLRNSYMLGTYFNKYSEKIYMLLVRALDI